LAAAAVVGAPAGIATCIIVGHPPADLLFLAADASAPAGPAVGAAGPLDAATIVGTPTDTVVGTTSPWGTAAITGAPAGIVVGAPAWPLFDPFMGRAPYRSTRHVFFMAPHYGFLVQPAWPSSFDPSIGRAPYWSMPHAFFTTP
jgi:hypothetical protein